MCAMEARRGCGFRKINGTYLVCDPGGMSCDRLPLVLDVCPTCHAGVKQSRGWTWVKPEILGGDHHGALYASHCLTCVVCTPDLLGERAGLLWIGDKFYTPQEFVSEANKLGVSRRIAAVPRGFKIGEDWVLLAHPKAVLPKFELKDQQEKAEAKPGIFYAFKPQRIEKILADDASADDVAKWEKQGFTVVKLPANDKDHRGSVFDDDE